MYYPPVHTNLFKAEVLLRLSDWTQLSDCGLTDACVSKFKDYRESLRTIRRTDPANPTFPTKPTEEWKS
jgi:hypothetical protein|tara:strand:- start:68 stop:274 length:207 start_codon:yes stop_codon:yes gene_type:complete